MRNSLCCWDYSDESNNRNHDTTATAVIFFNKPAYFKKSLSKKKFILPMSKFGL